MSQSNDNKNMVFWRKLRNFLIPAIIIVTALIIFMLIFHPGQDNIDFQSLLEVYPALWILPIAWTVMMILVFIASIFYFSSSLDRPEEVEESENTLKYMAEHDHLTSLVNRHTALEYLRSEIRPDSKFTIVLMDIDHFQKINEVYGHAFGDRMIVDLSREMQSYVKQFNGFLSRYGNDEFLILYPGEHLTADSKVISDMLDIIHKPITIGMANIVPTVSIGIACSDGITTADQIVTRADIAVNEAKKNGPHTVMVFSHEMQEKIEEHTRIKNNLFRAIQSDGLCMVYQPKIRANTLEVCGYEALVRIKDDPVAPSVFIPIAAENGWLREIGRITAHKIVQQLADWRDEGRKLLPVSLNFASIQLRDAEFLDYLLDQLKTHDISPRYVEIEIPESVMIDYTPETIDLMKQFNDAGIRIAMDNFGTGYSALNYLPFIPVSEIKIERLMLLTGLSRERRTKFLGDIVRLGHDLGMKMVFDGVETKEQYLSLAALGIDEFQGFLFSRPLAPEEAISFRISELPETGETGSADYETYTSRLLNLTPTAPKADSDGAVSS